MGEQEKPSWEHIAPELPPGWSLKLLLPACEEDDKPELVSALEARLGEVWRGERSECIRSAWEAFGITRKRYAELIAVERVREVAGAKYGRPALDGVIVIAKIHPDSCVFEIVWRDALSVYESEYSGPTLCDAAWACIKALGGGE